MDVKSLLRCDSKVSVVSSSDLPAAAPEGLNSHRIQLILRSGVRGAVTKCKLLTRLLGNQMMDHCGPAGRTKVQLLAKALEGGIDSEVQP